VRVMVLVQFSPRRSLEGAEPPTFMLKRSQHVSDCREVFTIMSGGSAPSIDRLG